MKVVSHDCTGQCIPKGALPIDQLASPLLYMCEPPDDLACLKCNYFVAVKKRIDFLEFLIPITVSHIQFGCKLSDNRFQEILSSFLFIDVCFS